MQVARLTAGGPVALRPRLSTGLPFDCNNKVPAERCIGPHSPGLYGFRWNCLRDRFACPERGPGRGRRGGHPPRPPATPYLVRRDRHGSAGSRTAVAFGAGGISLGDRGGGTYVALVPPRHLIRSKILNIGMYRAMTIAPTMPPSTAIMIGSIRDVSDSVVDSTSWS